MDNKEQQRETKPHNNTNHTAELIILFIATIFFAVIGIAQLVVFASGYGF